MLKNLSAIVNFQVLFFSAPIVLRSRYSPQQNALVLRSNRPILLVDLLATAITMEDIYIIDRGGGVFKSAEHKVRLGT